VNERKKIQITDSSKYSPPIARLNSLLASLEFLKTLSYITGMSNVLADEQLVGGGIHMTGPGGRLDVHVDFNYIEDRRLHRRLNLLVYLNDPWPSDWGGQFQLWDKDVKHCAEEFDPILNRCVIFETNEISFHGVVPVSPYALAPRKSFATYYYTREAPSHWKGISHSTIFKARPEERLKGAILMPAEFARENIKSGVRRIKMGLKGLLGR
jgi:Rps23 Pro-64 3,4-dihydroxylase Tpa1-like proline 4-hydroxylase